MISSAVVPSSESIGSTENSIPISEIRELIKTVNDRSFLLKADSVDSTLKRKAIELIKMMDQYINIDTYLNLPIVPVSDLPPSKKHKKS